MNESKKELPLTGSELKEELITRWEQGVSVRGMAELLDISQSTFYRWMKQDSPLSEKNMRKIRDYLYGRWCLPDGKPKATHGENCYFCKDKEVELYEYLTPENVLLTRCEYCSPSSSWGPQFSVKQVVNELKDTHYLSNSSIAAMIGRSEGTIRKILNDSVNTSSVTISRLHDLLCDLSGSKRSNVSSLKLSTFKKQAAYLHEGFRDFISEEMKFYKDREYQYLDRESAFITFCDEHGHVDGALDPIRADFMLYYPASHQGDKKVILVALMFMEDMYGTDKKRQIIIEASTFDAKYFGIFCKNSNTIELYQRKQFNIHLVYRKTRKDQLT